MRSRRRPWSPWALLLLVVLSGCADAVGPDPSLDLLDRLNALPGVAAREVEPYYGYPRAFELDITQPVDHDYPQGARFTQRAYLSHAGEELPMVFGTRGYGASRESGSELAGILQANGLYVVHRYFPDARPDPMDWEHLDIRQAASDHHRIVSLLKQLYAGPWVSTGGSKGGMTALFHRRFFPDDVDATVAYVAPLMFSLEDERFVPHVASLGAPEVREAIHGFQRRLLEHRDSLLWRFEAWFPANGWSLSIPAGSTFQGRVTGYEWNFWQRNDFAHTDIPGANEPYDAWIEHLAAVTRLHFRSDRYRDYFSAYIYQAVTQLGGAAIDVSHLQDLLVEEPLTLAQAYGLPEPLPSFDPAAMEDILAWLRTRGERIVYIYGGVDPWTGGAIELPGGIDALRVVQPGADHGVRIADLDDRSLVLTTLGGWLGLDLGSTIPQGVAPGAAAREVELVGIRH
jgi:hypothetical protein